MYFLFRGTQKFRYANIPKDKKQRRLRNGKKYAFSNLCARKNLRVRFQNEEIDVLGNEGSPCKVSLQLNLNLPHMMKIQKIDLQILCYTSRITRVLPDVFSGKENSSSRKKTVTKGKKSREVSQGSDSHVYHLRRAVIGAK